MKQVAFLSLALILFSNMALADNKMRIVCHRLAETGEADLKIKGVVVIEQNNTDLYRGDQLQVENMQKLMSTQKIPFTLRHYRTEMMPDNITRQNVEEYSNQLLEQDQKKPVVISTLGFRNLGTFTFKWVSSDPNVDGRTVFQFSPFSLNHSTYTTQYDWGGFNCFKPILIEENPVPESEQI